MLRFNKIYFLLTVLSLLYSGVYAQSKTVKWIALRGIDGEFVIFMPEGYLTTSAREIYLGKPPMATRVENELKIARQLNGVVLLAEFYQGNGKSIYKTLIDREKDKLALEKEGETSGFQFAHFSRRNDKSYQKIHYYYSKKGLYKLTAISKTETDKIAKGFFESVRLVNGNNVVAPNAPTDATATTLPNVIETVMPKLDDSAAIDAKEADRKLIILSQAYPRFTFDMRRGINSIRVKLKVLYSSSGTIGKVEVLEISSKLVEREAIETAKKAVFIPAEKDGKLISVYQIIEYSYGIEAR